VYVNIFNAKRSRDQGVLIRHLLICADLIKRYLLLKLGKVY
jgi:hypothetical protein